MPQSIENLTIAIFGLGRSGLAVAKAARDRGALPTVYDQSSLEALAKPDILTEAEALGLNVVLNWDGTLPMSDLLVVNPAVRKDHPLILQLKDQIEVISEVEFAYRISRAPILAITGTNGKSTTTVMLYRCLLAAGESAILCGNIFGSGHPEMPLTDAAAIATENQVLVAEISSFQLEWVREFRPKVAGITNITSDHLDRYEGVNDYARTKLRVFAAQQEDDFAVIRGHDPVVPKPKGPHVLTFGATAEHAHIDEDGISFFGERFLTANWSLQEPHNRANAAMAALMAYAFLKQKNAPAIQEALQNRQAKSSAKRTVYSGRTAEITDAMPSVLLEPFEDMAPLKHRMEFLGAKGGIRVINNSMCTNPDAVVKSAQSVRDSVHLLLGGVNKGLSFKPVKAFLANQRHRGYLFGRDAAEINTELGGEIPIFGTMQEAFAAATAAAISGEVIMLAPGCASSDQFRDFRHRGDVFTELAKEWLDHEN